jgi:hypothetical protein
MVQQRRHPIGDYALTYLRRFNALCDSEAKTALLSDLYLKKIGQAICYWSSEGVVIFFFPEDSVERDKTGVYLYDRLPESFSYIVQSYTGNLVKITPAPSERLRADLSNLPDLPPDLEKDKIRTGYINPEVLSENWGGPINFTGVSVAPLRHYEDGLLVKTLESRFHLWSPALRMPSGKNVRQYSWIAADFLWYDIDNYPSNFGEEAAESDFHVLRLGREARLGPEKLAYDPFGAVSKHLLEVCLQFELLINNDAVDESAVQRFLAEPAHQFLVSPVHRLIYPQKRLGGGRFVLDFAIQKSDGEWEFIEIEAPGRAIYQRAGEEPSAHLTHAIAQVEDWLRFVDDNRYTVEREDGFPGIYRPGGRVVAGRDDDLGEQAQRRFKFRRAESQRIQLQTYDLLLKEARSYAEVLARMRAQQGGYQRNA